MEKPNNNTNKEERGFLETPLKMHDALKRGMERGSLEKEDLIGLTKKDLILLRDKVIRPWIETSIEGKIWGNIKLTRYILRTVLTFGLGKVALARTAMPLVDNPEEGSRAISKAKALISQLDDIILNSADSS